MQAHFEITNDLERRVVYTRMTGTFARADMIAWARAYRDQATLPYNGRRHMVIANMLGMKTLNPAIAHIMGEEIGHSRRNGAVLCAHLSDDTVQRLQAARLARKNSPHDDVTVEVVSLQEARRVIASCARRIDDPRFAGAIRAALGPG